VHLYNTNGTRKHVYSDSVAQSDVMMASFYRSKSVLTAYTNSATTVLQLYSVNSTHMYTTAYATAACDVAADCVVAVAVLVVFIVQ
jgi:hypothetical protein